MEKMFKALDVNHDGSLSKKELLKGFTKTMGKEKAAQKVEQIFKTIDTDNSNEITYSEFLTAGVDRSKFLSKKVLKAAFKMFDTDESGSIDVQEVKKILQNGHIDNKTIENMIQEVSKEGETDISFMQFYKLMTGMDHTHTDPDEAA